MKYFLVVAFLVPAFVAAWCWPWLMDFYVVSQHGQRWGNCMYLAGVALPMMVFCLLILGVEWFASRGRPRVDKGVTLDFVDHRALGRGWVIQKIAKPIRHAEPALNDDLKLAPGEELIRIHVAEDRKNGEPMNADANQNQNQTQAAPQAGGDEEAGQRPAAQAGEESGGAEGV